MRRFLFWQFLECYNRKKLREREIFDRIASFAAKGLEPNKEDIVALGEITKWFKDLDRCELITDADVWI